MPNAVAIIGGGVMGRRLTCHFLRAGKQVAMVDPSHQAIENAREFLASQQVDTGHLTTAHNATELPAHWRDCPLVIEAVPENLDLKRNILAGLEHGFGPETIIASNTSGLTSAEIGAGMRHPERLAIAHFFNPADVIPAVEVIGSATMPRARVEKLAEILRQSGKMPVILQAEVPGFIANRVQHVMMRECFHLLETGVADAEAIDTVLKYSIGVRLALTGPFLQRDLNGLDTHLSIATYLYPELSAASTPPRILQEMAAEGALGRKAGRGFYSWDEAREAQLQASERALADIVSKSMALDNGHGEED